MLPRCPPPPTSPAPTRRSTPRCGERSAPRSRAARPATPWRLAGPACRAGVGYHRPMGNPAPALVAARSSILVGALLLAVTAGGCTTAARPAPWQAGNLQPLTIGWQRYFEVEWTATRQDEGVLIGGYITNTWGFAFREVRVLVNGYDGAGQQVGQMIAWGPNAIEPG